MYLETNLERALISSWVQKLYLIVLVCCVNRKAFCFTHALLLLLFDYYFLLKEREV